MKYMLAVDKSRSALHALVWILKHAKADDHVYLAHVYHMEANVNVVPCIDSEWRAQMRGEALLKRLADKLEKRNIAHTTVIDHGDARKKLPKRAKELGVDVIVMGRRGMTADKRSPVGSVSQYVVEHAPCSVIVIKEEKGQSAQEEAEDEPTEAKEEEEQKTSSE